MNERVRTPFNSAPELRPGCTHQLGCRCERPYWLLDSGDPKLSLAETEHRRRLGMDRIRVPSTFAVCVLIGCMREEAHEHEVVA